MQEEAIAARSGRELAPLGTSENDEIRSSGKCAVVRICFVSQVAFRGICKARWENFGWEFRTSGTALRTAVSDIEASKFKLTTLCAGVVPPVASSR